MPYNYSNQQNSKIGADERVEEPLPKTECEKHGCCDDAESVEEWSPLTFYKEGTCVRYTDCANKDKRGIYVSLFPTFTMPGGSSWELCCSIQECPGGGGGYTTGDPGDICKEPKEKYENDPYSIPRWEFGGVKAGSSEKFASGDACKFDLCYGSHKANRGLYVATAYPGTEIPNKEEGAWKFCTNLTRPCYEGGGGGGGGGDGEGGTTTTTVAPSTISHDLLDPLECEIQWDPSDSEDNLLFWYDFSDEGHILKEAGDSLISGVMDKSQHLAINSGLFQSDPQFMPMYDGFSSGANFTGGAFLSGMLSSIATGGVNYTGFSGRNIGYFVVAEISENSVTSSRDAIFSYNHEDTTGFSFNAGDDHFISGDILISGVGSPSSQTFPYFTFNTYENWNKTIFSLEFNYPSGDHSGEIYSRLDTSYWYSNDNNIIDDEYTGQYPIRYVDPFHESGVLSLFSGFDVNSNLSGTVYEFLAVDLDRIVGQYNHGGHDQAGALLIENSSHSRQVIEGYLMHKWGLHKDTSAEDGTYTPIFINSGHKYWDDPPCLCSGITTTTTAPTTTPA